MTKIDKTAVGWKRHPEGWGASSTTRCNPSGPCIHVGNGMDGHVCNWFMSWESCLIAMGPTYSKHVGFQVLGPKRKICDIQYISLKIMWKSGENHILCLISIPHQATTQCRRAAAPRNRYQGSSSMASAVLRNLGIKRSQHSIPLLKETFLWSKASFIGLPVWGPPMEAKGHSYFRV